MGQDSREIKPGMDSKARHTYRRKTDTPADGWMETKTISWTKSTDFAFWNIRLGLVPRGV